MLAPGVYALNKFVFAFPVNIRRLTPPPLVGIIVLYNIIKMNNIIDYLCKVNYIERTK
jgi:hypothetical protein